MKSKLALLLVLLLGLAGCSNEGTPIQDNASPSSSSIEAQEDSMQTESIPYQIFYGVKCTIDDEEYELDGETLTVRENGTGTVYYNSEDHDLAWTQIEDCFSFRDISGNSFEGTIDDGVIQGVFTRIESDGLTKQYEYIYALEDSLSEAASAEALIYTSVSCVINGEDSFIAGEGMILNSDGTGMIRFGDTNLEMNWSSNGELFTFTDVNGHSFEGTMSDAQISGVYAINNSDGTTDSIEYVYQITE